MDQSNIVLGLWPIAGITTIGVTTDDASATIAAAIEAGITSFDTAYSYGYDGESDRLLGSFLGTERERFTVLAKVGQRWDSQRKRIIDGSAGQLILDAEASLRRMRIDFVDVLFLHSPDPKIPIEESAAALLDLKTRGLCRHLGICNATPMQIEQFSQQVATDAIQCPLNMVQRESQHALIEPAALLGRNVYVFWTLMKGLLAGKITRDHHFQVGDSRPGYAIFQGDMRERVHHAIDRLQILGREIDQSIAQLSVGWAISQTGVTAAIVGARRPNQILETLGARKMTTETLIKIDQIITESCWADDSPDE